MLWPLTLKRKPQPMPIDSLLALLVFAFVTSITPGPNNLMLLASGVNFGFWRTLPHMLGVMGGFCFLLSCVGFGLGVLLTAYPTFHLALKIAGGSYLLYLAWRIATSRTLGQSQAGAAPMSFLGASLFQWVNPKAWMMALTSIALYAAPDSDSLSIFLVALVFGVVNLPCIAIWVGCGSALRRLLAAPERLRWFNGLMGLLLALTLIPMLQ